MRSRIRARPSSSVSCDRAERRAQPGARASDELSGPRARHGDLGARQRGAALLAAAPAARGLDDRRVALSLAKVLVASMVMAAAAWGIEHGLSDAWPAACPGPARSCRAGRERRARDARPHGSAAAAPRVRGRVRARDLALRRRSHDHADPQPCRSIAVCCASPRRTSSSTATPTSTRRCCRCSFPSCI